jgi:hypothetical protein
MKFCPYCGAAYSDETVVCSIDGNPLEGCRKLSWQDSVRDLFSRGECRGKKFIAICNALAGVNARCSEYTFGIDRVAKIRFRGREVCLVLGDVGSLAPAGGEDSSGWSQWPSVYALAASREQITWMTANSDVFSPARPDSSFPVFWVNLDAIRANQTVQRTGASRSAQETNPTSPAAGSHR